jgi:hypothetical protein
MIALVVLGGLAVAAVLAEMASPGPARGLVGVSRYGFVPFALVALVAAGLAGWFLLPEQRLNIISAAILAALALIWTGRRYHWLRRAGVRGRWPSVARSCGLARLDRRGESWPFDATTTVTGAVRVEWLPIINRPRHVEGVGVRFRLTPARGGKLDDVAQVAEELAAGLRVARVEVTRISPSKGELLAVW